MSDPRMMTVKRSLLLAGAVLVIAGLCATIAAVNWAHNAKSRFQQAASDALGLQVTIGGSVKLRFFPSFGVTLQDVHIRNHDAELASAQAVRLGIGLLPLLRHELQISAIALVHLVLAVEQNRDGTFNFALASAAGGGMAIDSTDVSLNDATIHYTNQQNGNQWQAVSCDMQANHFQLATSGPGDLISQLELTAAVGCKRIETRKLIMDDVKFTLDSKQGLFAFKGITMQAYAGQGSGEISADFAGRTPTFRVHYALSKFRIEEFWAAISPKKVIEGSMNFSTDLTLSGHTVAEMTRSSVGEASLRGSNLTLEIGDLDSELSKYESTQKFNLIDLGAFLVAGPLGVGVSKGYDYARVLTSQAGSSEVPNLISEWHVDHGVALAKDVAMTTKKNRLALKGALDFVNDRFQDVTVALVDEKGCVRVQQRAGGPFSQPDVAKPNVMVSLTGPVKTLVKQAKHLLGVRCEVFYSGALAPPP
ncbi:MAG: AsmA family protein [Steroidobacteraceae bacterium]